jgi:hypothetical protein
MTGLKANDEQEMWKDGIVVEFFLEGVRKITKDIS